VGIEAKKERYGRTQEEGFLMKLELKSWIKEKKWVMVLFERVCGLKIQMPRTGPLTIISTYCLVRDVSKEVKEANWVCIK
jgi:hypothetical protein